MTAVLTQPSNNTGLAITRELSPSVVDGTARWEPQEPNTYKDFGATYKTKARMPINSSRQNTKGVIVDLDTGGGWQEDVTYEGVQHKMEGLMYADFRRKAELPVTGVTTSNDQYAVAAGGGAIHPGDLLFASNFVQTGNNGLKTVATSASGDVGVVENLVDDTTGNISVVGHQFASGDLLYTAATKTLATTAFDLTTFGLIPGEYLYCTDDVAGTSLGSNLGMARINRISTNAIVFDKVFAAVPGAPIVDGGAGKTARVYFSRVIKNELVDLIKHYTYQAERTLGKDDTAAANQQAEYLTGGVINEAVFTFNTADKITCEWSLLAARHEVRTSAVGLKPGVRPVGIETSAFNTTTDVKFMSLELANSDTPLYAYLMDLSLTVKNNAKANKAISVLGAISLIEGQFTVSAAATAYFANVSAAHAIEANSDVTLSACLARDNHGIVFDVPLISLGDGRPKITANEPIQLPLTIDAARASSLNPNTDYTLMVMFFDYLPTIATT